MKKRIYILIGLVVVSSFALVSSAQAGTLTSVTITPSTSYGGLVGSYDVTFTVASSTEIKAEVRLIFPSSFTLPSTIASSTITMSSTLAAAIVGSSTVSGQEITFFLDDGLVAVSGDTIIFTGIPGIQSPYAGGSFQLGVQTRTQANLISDSASSTVFAIFGGPPVGEIVEDISAPISKITSPANSVTIVGGTSYTIYGTGTDTGGSTVTKVEISLDGGQTWFPAPSNASGGNFNWEYIWQNPTEGAYTIKIRATDSSGNMESASASVSITVTAPAGAPAGVQIPTEATEQPTVDTTTTIQTLQNQVAALQQTLLGLLQQLVQLLQAQL
ncbi:hypothetical protein IIA94_00475 [Patescibacteria group bacterium]|nr:hypothetical protein [Patescibacteria group bacterium]